MTARGKDIDVEYEAYKELPISCTLGGEGFRSSMLNPTGDSGGVIDRLSIPGVCQSHSIWKIVGYLATAHIILAKNTWLNIRFHLTVYYNAWLKSEGQRTCVCIYSFCP